jgi:hypothetical protein
VHKNHRYFLTLILGAVAFLLDATMAALIFLVAHGVQ